MTSAGGATRDTCDASVPWVGAAAAVDIVGEDEDATGGEDGGVHRGGPLFCVVLWRYKICNFLE